MELYFQEHENEKKVNRDENEETLDEYIRRITEEFIAQSTNATPPASKLAIRNLEVIWIDKEHLKVTEDCPICTETFEIGTRATILPCKHFFHGECLVTWLKKQATCPLCRHEILTDDSEYELKKLDKQNPHRKKDNLDSMYM